MSPMKILLIYPEFPDTFWGYKHTLKFIRKKAAYPPLGLLTLGAMLPQEWPKRLIDLNVRKLTEKDLSWADCAFISGINVQRDSARQIISLCKEAGLRVVAGGPIFTTEYKHFDKVDHFVLNEAELTLPPFLSELNNGCAKRVYKTSDFADLHETPPPLWELADLSQYASMTIQFSRGCPFNCGFCNVTALFGHRARIKTTEQIINELESLYSLGWRGHIFFADDNFIGKKRYIKTQLLPALIEWRRSKRRISFSTQVTIDLADDVPLMEMMTLAGFNAVFIGIETPDKKSLAECNKKPNENRDLVESVKQIQRRGLEVMGGFIIGFDSDTPSIFQRQIDFIQQSAIVIAMVGLLQAPPGTRLYSRMKKEGRLLGLLTANTDGTTNIVTKMEPKTLREGYRNILRNIYSPEFYYRRVKMLSQDYKAPKSKFSIDFQQLMALLRSVIRLGIYGNERVQYWKLLSWMLLRRPQFLPLAIRLAIKGYHFRKVCESYTSD